MISDRMSLSLYVPPSLQSRFHVAPGRTADIFIIFLCGKQHFKENPYFTNKTLSKRYTLKKGLKPAPADGSVTDELRKFNEEQDLQVNVCQISSRQSLYEAMSLTFYFYFWDIAYND